MWPNFQLSFWFTLPLVFLNCFINESIWASTILSFVSSVWPLCRVFSNLYHLSAVFLFPFKNIANNVGFQKHSLVLNKHRKQGQNKLFLFETDTEHNDCTVTTDAAVTQLLTLFKRNKIKICPCLF